METGIIIGGENISCMSGKPPAERPPTMNPRMKFPRHPSNDLKKESPRVFMDMNVAVEMQGSVHVYFFQQSLRGLDSL